jgi:hypothetical protein
MIRTSSILLSLLVVGLGCASAPAPIPLSGSRADVSVLTGEWVGEYSSRETSRGGSITFSLAVGSDTAFGDVLMVPHGFDHPLLTPDRTAASAPTTPGPEVLTIRLVRSEGGVVTGTLDPYRDPECGCTLQTTFKGSLIGDSTIEGTFVSTGGANHPLTMGRWKVTRVKR